MSQTNSENIGGAIVIAALIIALGVGVPACGAKTELARVHEALERTDSELERIADALEYANMEPEEQATARARRQESQRRVDDVLKGLGDTAPKF